MTSQMNMSEQHCPNCMTATVWDASLSTMWARNNFHDLRDFFRAARQMGFARIELNHQVDSGMLSGIDLSDFKFSSIHEPCPADISVDTLKSRDWLVSAPDEDNRRQGVAAVKRSIDLAQDLGVSVVVVHSGNVLADMRLENRLRDLFAAGMLMSDEFQTLKTEMINARSAKVEPRLEAVKNSLLELLEYASHYGICLGLENRYHFMDIPNPDEMEQLLGLSQIDRIGFVYDVGHAQALDRLMFYAHVDWLKRFSHRMIGVHLHDILGVNDHYPPGQGEIEYDTIAPYLSHSAFRTLELHPRTTPEQVQAGLRFLAIHGCVHEL
jgi:sugar phosphate isomerase/epimerase